MARADWIDATFRCSICGDAFEALTGGQPVADPVCLHCALRHSNEKRRKLIEERKKKRGSR